MQEECRSYRPAFHSNTSHEVMGHVGRVIELEKLGQQIITFAQIPPSLEVVYLVDHTFDFWI